MLSVSQFVFYRAPFDPVFGINVQINDKRIHPSIRQTFRDAVLIHFIYLIYCSQEKKEKKRKFKY